MVAGSEKPSLEERESVSKYTLDDAGVPPLQRLAAALHDRYNLERIIGRGATAYVYLARDLREDRLVALKVLRPEFAAPIADARFHREIEIVRHLHHPNILRLLDFGSVENRLYFTTPYVEGDTLRARMRREGPLSVTDALSIAHDVACALDYAHEQGVLHRDVKPANILLDNGNPLIADFGVARAMIVAAGDEITTHSGLAIGTPEYMSPEQGAGETKLDARCDIYALGCVVHEMLAGEPPFTGPSAQAVIARHCLQPLQSIRVIRPEVPVGVEMAIAKALAKVPADRFATGAEFAIALEAGLARGAPSFFSRIRRRTVYRALAGFGALAILAVGYVFRAKDLPLDPNRVVVFPLQDSDPRIAGDGEAVATYVGYALDGTRPLKWLDGWELLDQDQRSNRARLDPQLGRTLTRNARAAFYIDGSIVRRPDSVTVILKLFSLLDDSVIRIVGSSAPKASASVAQLGVSAVAELLPALVAPGGRIDLSTFGRRKPAAIANFLQGEREYRRMQFTPALTHYQAALAADSEFTLAASRGAYAANWLSEFETGNDLAKVALGRPQSLSPAQLLLTRGLKAYLEGAADSAITYLSAAVKTDSLVHAGWTLLGEVYSRLLPRVANADSLSRDALSRALVTDSDFAPTLLLLEERALRAGRVPEAVRLQGALRKAGADTTHQASRRLMFKCVRDGAASVDWTAARKQDEMTVLSTGKILAADAAQPECAIASFRSIVHADSASVNGRWAAFLGLQTQLAAVGRSTEASKEFGTKELAALPVKFVYLLLAGAGDGFEREATGIADSAVGRYGLSSVPSLWFLANWEIHRRDIRRVRSIADALRHKADSTGSRRDRLVRDAIVARLRLLEGDSVGALGALRALAPSAARQQLAWDPWESLGPERMEFANLLYGRGELNAAFAVATQLDATEPLVYPLYLRPSLILRLRIAETKREATLAAEYRRRIAQLDWPG